MRKGKMESVDSELLSKDIYREVFSKLVEKLKSGTARSHSYVFHPDLTLSWILAHQKKIIQIILEEIKKESFAFDTIKHTLLFTDKARDIYIAAWPERILLLALGLILTKRLTPSLARAVYSFQKGRGPHEAVRDALLFVKKNESKPLFILKRDISKYGDSIPQKALFNSLAEVPHFKDAPLFLKLVQSAIRIPFSPSDSDPEACLCVGIPSGSPLVPPLENFYLSPLDDKLSNLNNSFYGRYGDDFIFITPCLDLAKTAANIISSTISDLGLSMKEEKVLDACLDFSKTIHVPPFVHKTHITWLGLSITNHALLGPKPPHFRYVLDSLKSEVSGLFLRAKNSNLPLSDQKEIIRLGLQQLLLRNGQSAFQAYLYDHEDHFIFRLIDKRVVELVFKHLRSDLLFSKKEAWKALRSFKIPSTFYERFMKRKIKKQAVKTGVAA